jgi:hypothetical protein
MSQSAITYLFFKEIIVSTGVILKAVCVGVFATSFCAFLACVAAGSLPLSFFRVVLWLVSGSG